MLFTSYMFLKTCRISIGRKKRMVNNPIISLHYSVLHFYFTTIWKASIIHSLLYQNQLLSDVMFVCGSKTNINTIKSSTWPVHLTSNKLNETKSQTIVGQDNLERQIIMWWSQWTFLSTGRMEKPLPLVSLWRSSFKRNGRKLSMKKSISVSYPISQFFIWVSSFLR